MLLIIMPLFWGNENQEYVLTMLGLSRRPNNKTNEIEGTEIDRLQSYIKTPNPNFASPYIASRHTTQNNPKNIVHVTLEMHSDH